MNISMLKGKIHRATVKQAELDYVGSITVDNVLLEAAGILEYEHVHIVDVNNGSRFETYTIPGEPGSGMICLNGPAARCVATGDKIIIIAYADMTPEEAKTFEPKVVFVTAGRLVMSMLLCKTPLLESVLCSLLQMKILNVRNFVLEMRHF